MSRTGGHVKLLSLLFLWSSKEINPSLSFDVFRIWDRFSSIVEE